MDIIDRLRIAESREPHDPVYVDAIIEIELLRAKLSRRPQHYFGPVYVPPMWEQPSTVPFLNIPVITCRSGT